MRDYAIAGALLAFLANNEAVTLFLLLVAAVFAVYKLFNAASERGC